MLQNETARSRTRYKPPATLPKGVLEKYLKSTLDIYEVATAQTVANMMPRHLRKRNLTASTQSILRRGVKEGWLIRPTIGYYVLADGGVTWRKLFKLARPDLHAIVTCIGDGWANTYKIETYLRRKGVRMTTLQLQYNLRWLKKRKVARKSGRDDWRLTPEIDAPCTPPPPPTPSKAKTKTTTRQTLQQ